MTKQPRRSEMSSGVVLAVLVCVTRLFAAQRADDSALVKAESAIAAEFAKSGAPGAAVAVVVGAEVVWARGFGVANAETGAPVTPDTLFQIGSVTKAFTAAALLSANTQGVVALDRQVSTYVTGLSTCVGAPTLTQLLSHTGGLMDEPDEFGPQGEEGLAAYARTWTSGSCLLPPGRAFSYSNSGFALAGLAVQEAEKKPFADVMRARVLDPLGDEANDISSDRGDDVAARGGPSPGQRGRRSRSCGRWPTTRGCGRPGRCTRARTRWRASSQALLGDGRVPGAPGLPAGIVGANARRTVEIPTTAQRYGLGLFHTAGKFGHGGTMTGYVAQLEVDPAANLAVVVLTNGDNANPTAMAGAARRIGLAVRGQPEDPDADQGISGSVAELGADAARYVATFTNPRRFTVEVVRQGEGLVLKRFGRDFPMRYASPGRFLVDLPRGGTETIAFGIGPDGRADYLQMNVWALARVK